MLDIIIIFGLIIDLIAAILIYYGKIFRSVETIEKMSKYLEEEIKHRIFETKLARVGSILLILGFLIQIIGYAINIRN
ncbi:MAG TPA: hypothetical protein VN703_05245 [Candidatus Sulfopaludibacter sp.]|nr:hypothetical protein [Candidatus Sulfopaludibacter sp.]